MACTVSLSSTEKVVRYSKQGDVIQQYIHNEEKEHLFLNPEKIATGVNGDVYVVDTERKCVTAVDVTGKIQYVYAGSKANKVDPSCIARGPLGSVLVGE